MSENSASGGHHGVIPVSDFTIGFIVGVSAGMFLGILLFGVVLA